uniref:EGF-like domain-containing protein n=1 Tax=Plectus sambesii TaxID=2011161 RepID=A0A914VYS4_9BILA
MSFGVRRLAVVVFIAIYPLYAQVAAQRPINDDCFRDDLRTMNQTCNSGADCTTGLACVKGVCQCGPGMEETTVRIIGPDGRQYPCRPLPQIVGQPCINRCHDPLICDAETRLCACPQGYTIRQQGMQRVCYRECTNDEILDVHLGMHLCRPKCKKNQVRVGLECHTAANLGESCESNFQCIGLFSHCVGGKCACHEGYVRSEDNACIPQTFGCRFGEPLREGGNIIACEVKAKNLHMVRTKRQYMLPTSMLPYMILAAPGVEDTCPPDSYCQTYMPFGSPLGQEGHCCPKAKPLCPVGEPHPGSPRCSTRHNNCPHDTHFCYNPGTINHQPQEALCCSKPCAGDALYRNGLCYQYASMSEECSFDEQCERVNGKCIQGKCACGPNSEEMPNMFPRQCLLRCRTNEVQIGTDCVRRMKIGEVCEEDRLCASGAVCRDGKCQCGCDMIQIADDICGTQPSCPPLTFSMLGLPNTPPVQHPVFCKAQLTGNAPDSAPIKFNVNVVDRCPTDHFCNGYQPWFGLGVCCEKPEPICPDGSSVDSKATCNPREPTSCGEQKMCHRFFIPADAPESNEGFVCCPLPKDPLVTVAPTFA